MSEALSVQAFATVIGVSRQAVEKAIKSGRLRASVERNAKGRPVIADVEAAKGEWTASASKLRAVPGGATGGGGAVAAVADADDTAAETSSPLEADSLVDAQRIVTLERARAIRLSLDVKRGQLLERNAVVKLQFETTRTIREAMLNIAARLAHELAAETGTDAGRMFVRLDGAIREALSTVAERFEALAATSDRLTGGVQCP